jgi:hypothetical protein
MLTPATTRRPRDRAAFWPPLPCSGMALGLWTLMCLLVLPRVAAPASPAAARQQPAPTTVAVRAQAYQVHLRHSFVVWGDVRGSACGGTCSEGHDCTACVGVRVLKDDSVLSTAVYDKTPCCVADVSAPTRLDRLSLLSPWCGVHSCPLSSGANSNLGPFSAELDDALGCIAAGEPVPVARYRALAGSLSNNAIACGSRCSATDPFSPFDPGSRGDDAYGGFVVTCPSNDPSIICLPVAECPEADRDAVLPDDGPGAPLRRGARDLRSADDLLERVWGWRHRFF